jgi:hypothetical protein
LTTGSFPHDNLSSVYWIFTKHGHMIPLWKGKNPIYFGIITIIPFDNWYRQAYFVMHTLLVSLWFEILTWFLVCERIVMSYRSSLNFVSLCFEILTWFLVCECIVMTYRSSLNFVSLCFEILTWFLVLGITMMSYRSSLAFVPTE